MTQKKAEEKTPKKVKTIEVKLDIEEYKDLEEFCKHHPEKAKDPGEALKKMAGLKFYRRLKKTVDGKRKRPSLQRDFLPQDLGIPTWIPCVLADQLKELGMTYSEFISKSVEAGVNLFMKAIADPYLQKELIAHLKRDDKVLKGLVHTCEKCGKEVLANYPPPCPNCGRCFHYTVFGSDLRCPCKQQHYWYGLGWLPVVNGKTQFPEHKEIVEIG